MYSVVSWSALVARQTPDISVRTSPCPRSCSAIACARFASAASACCLPDGVNRGRMTFVPVFDLRSSIGTNASPSRLSDTIFRLSYTATVIGAARPLRLIGIDLFQTGKRVERTCSVSPITREFQTTLAYELKSSLPNASVFRLKAALSSTKR